MTNIATKPAPSQARWQASQVYALAAVCLVVGVLVGYLFRGSESSLASSKPAATANGPAAGNPGRQMPSLEQMKHMADEQAKPLLVQLQSDSNNAALLEKIATIYQSTHQFKEGIGYYERSLNIAPNNTAVRNELASCLYYTGDADGAINQLEQVLKTDPKNTDSLFNLGVIKWQAKNDPSGALAAWQQLLKSNPKLAHDKRAQVESLIAEVKRGNSSEKQF
jgi:cytochrome c-type biogenesis protein CcmH/NrfG